MIVTALDMYTNLGQLLNKVRTQSVTVPEFNRLINISQMNVVTNKYLAAVQLNQKRIDDLVDITVQNEVINNTGANVPQSELFLIKSEVLTVPWYLHMLTVLVKLQYVNNECHTGVSEWLETKVMVSDFRADVSLDPFRKSKDNRLYYRIDKNAANKYVRVFAGGSSYGTQVMVDYLRYPITINLDPNGNTANDVNCELPVEVRQEIVYDCLRELLEDIESPRFNTNTQRLTDIAN